MGIGNTDIMALNEAPDDRLDEMLHKLKSRGFRVTPQRLAVLRIVAESDDHPSVEEIYEKVTSEFPTTSLATVYKIIGLLKGLNEILELGFPDESNRYDGRKPFPHPHAICMKCRKILDPELKSFDDLKQEIGMKTGFKIIHHSLDFFGLCRECQEKK